MLKLNIIGMTNLELEIGRLSQAVDRLASNPKVSQTLSSLTEFFCSGIDERGKLEASQLLQSLMVLVVVTKSSSEAYNAAVLVKALVNSGLASWQEIGQIELKTQEALKPGSAKIIQPEEIPAFAAQEKKLGKVVGLAHGTCRYLTLAHCLHLLDARQKCDSLIFGIESGKRALEFKGVKPILSDVKRLQLFAAIPMTTKVFLIEGERTGPDFYSELVQQAAPGVYFTSVGYTPELNAQRAARAQKAGATLVTLPFYSGMLSTKELEPLIRKL